MKPESSFLAPRGEIKTFEQVASWKARAVAHLPEKLKRTRIAARKACGALAAKLAGKRCDLEALVFDDAFMAARALAIAEVEARLVAALPEEGHAQEKRRKEQEEHFRQWEAIMRARRAHIARHDLSDEEIATLLKGSAPYKELELFDFSSERVREGVVRYFEQGAAVTLHFNLLTRLFENEPTEAGRLRLLRATSRGADRLCRTALDPRPALARNARFPVTRAVAEYLAAEYAPHPADCPGARRERARGRRALHAAWPSLAA